MSPTPSLELDEDYAARRTDEDMDRTARLRRWNEDVIWRTRLQMQEWNLNQCAREQDVREANLRRQKHRVQRREAQLRAELHAARIRGRGRGRGRG